MQNKKILTIILISVCIFSTGQFTSETTIPVQIFGTGSTFSQPIINEWASAFNNMTNKFVQITYGGGGSGVGITQITDHTVDFAGSDAPLSSIEQAATNQNGAVINHIPETMGAIVLIYNLPTGLTGTLNLTASDIAQMYQLNMTSWNNSALKAHNPGLTSTANIKVVRRSDSSGTSYVFSDYLTRATTDWVLGTNKSPNWPGGTLGGNGNSGVADLVSSTPNSIGYVEYGYAQANNLKSANIQNKDGYWVSVSTAGVIAAASEAATNLPAGSGSWSSVSINDQAGSSTYPICTLTYLLVYSDLSAYGAKGPALVAFLTWIMSDQAQNMASTVGLVSLPSNIRQLNLNTISTLKYSSNYNADNYLPSAFNSTTLTATNTKNKTSPGFDFFIPLILFAVIAVIKIRKKTSV